MDQILKRCAIATVVTVFTATVGVAYADQQKTGGMSDYEYSLYNYVVNNDGISQADNILSENDEAVFANVTRTIQLMDVTAGGLAEEDNHTRFDDVGLIDLRK